MRAEHVVERDDTFSVRVLPVDREPNGPLAPARLYRNRVRLNATETLHETSWRGPLEAGDLLEADCELPVELRIHALD